MNSEKILHLPPRKTKQIIIKIFSKLGLLIYLVSLSISSLKLLDKHNTSNIQTNPIDIAKEVNKVLPFFKPKFLKFKISSSVKPFAVGFQALF